MHDCVRHTLPVIPTDEPFALQPRSRYHVSDHHRGLVKAGIAAACDLLLKKHVSAGEQVVSHAIEPRMESTDFRQQGFWYGHIGADQPFARNILNEFLRRSPINNRQRTYDFIREPFWTWLFPDRPHRSADHTDRLR